jgi:hypothetical protein
LNYDYAALNGVKKESVRLSKMEDEMLIFMTEKVRPDKHLVMGLKGGLITF